MKKYLIHTYGCQMNVHESEKIAGILRSKGFEEAAGEAEADVIVFNTCCIRETAEAKIMGHIGQVKKLKRARPELKVVVCGCMSQQEGAAQQIFEKFPFVDAVLGTANLHLLEDVINKNENFSTSRFFNRDFLGDNDDRPIFRTSGTNAWVNIIYGCNNFCTYCIVPYVRGRERSRPADEIEKEVRTLLDEGYKEITLLGQNVNSYGNDLKDGTTFAGLLERLGQIEGKHRIRFMTSHPKDFNQSVVDVMEKYPSLCRNIHLPVQSGSNAVLKKMNRRYTSEQYLDLVKMIKARLPEVGLTTDVMVGFPGETDEDFDDTLKLLEEARFSGAFCFVYSRRKGTPGYSMENQVPQEIKTERIKKLIALQNRITKEISREHEGKIFEILVEDKNEKFENTYCGRTDGGRLVNFKSSVNLVGQFVNVKIKTSRSATLWGDLVTEEK